MLYFVQFNVVVSFYPLSGMLLDTAEKNWQSMELRSNHGFMGASIACPQSDGKTKRIFVFDQPNAVRSFSAPKSTQICPHNTQITKPNPL